MPSIESETLREITPGLEDGHYTILDTLREGRLHLAEKAGKRFVLKTAEGAKGLDMLKREYEISIGLTHPSLAYVFTWEDDSPVGPCIVQEFIDGRSLSKWLEENPPLRDRKRIFEELLDVTAYLHKKGVIHNDLTPENILVSRADNSLKLIDLGYADDGGHLAHSLGGTRGYAAPELVSGEKVDARSDIYSIGRLMQDIFPGRYRRIARKCLRKDPTHRYQTVEEIPRAIKARRLPLQIVTCTALAGLLAWPLFIKPHTVEVPVVDQAKTDSLRSVVDSLHDVINRRDLEETLRKEELTKAKDKVEAVYSSAIPAFRKALLDADNAQEVTDAWMAFLEDQKKVNFAIPDAAPESIRPALRDYIIQRNNEILPILGDEMNARLRELSH